MNTSLSSSEESGRQALENSILNRIFETGTEEIETITLKICTICVSHNALLG